MRKTPAFCLVLCILFTAVGCLNPTATHSSSIDSHYESIVAYPTFNVAGSSSTVQAAYNNYRQAIGIIPTSNRDLYTQCLDWVNKGSQQEFASSLTWMTARQDVDQPLQLIIPAIEMLQ